MGNIAHYTIEAELGRGGMGVVYRAKDTLIGRYVAIKALPVGLTSADNFRDILLKEARAAGHLTHPNIVTIHHVQVESDAVYIVMELVEGHTLDPEAAADQKAPAERTLALLSQAADALDYAHSRGVVHRDVKPSNFLVTPDGLLKLTDFGIAKLSEVTGPHSQSQLVGTPFYMAPEVIEGHRVDGRADQFSLAVVAWQMLTGDRPFRGDTAVAVLYNIVHSEPVVPTEARISGAVIGTLQRALAKEPHIRFTTCREFLDALRQSLRVPETSVVPRPSTGLLHRAWWLCVPLVVAVASTLLYRQTQSSARPVAPTIGSFEKSGGQQTNPSASQPHGAKNDASQTNSRTDIPKAAVRAFKPPPSSAHPPISSQPAGISDAPLASGNPSAPTANIAGILTVIEPVQPRAITAGAPAPKRPNGTLVWDGQLRKGEKLTIDGEQASPGSVSGTPLPGLAIDWRAEPAYFDVLEAPGPQNEWKRLVLQNKTKISVTRLQIRWTLKPATDPAHPSDRN